MIKVNLLPHKRLKPVDKSIMRLRAFVMVLTVLVVLGVGWMFYSLVATRSDRNLKLEQTTRQLQSLKETIKEVEGYEKTRKEIEEKLKIIDSLEKKKAPVTLLLSELNASTTRDVWFTALRSMGASFTVEGMAKGGRQTVDAYLEKVKKAPVFADIKLDDSKEDPAQGAGIFVFKLSGKLAGYETAPPPQAQAAVPAQPGSGNKPVPVQPGSSNQPAPAGTKK